MPQPPSGCAFAADPHREMTGMISASASARSSAQPPNCRWPTIWPQGRSRRRRSPNARAARPATTFRLMRACAAFGLPTTDGPDRFHGTPLLDTLRADAPRSLRAFAMAVTNSAHWLPWIRFGASVRTGHSQAHNALGMDFFDYLERNPAQAQEFSAGMSSGTSAWALELADLIDTTNVRARWTSAAPTARFWRCCRRPTRHCMELCSIGPISRETPSRTSLETVSPNAPRSLAATSSSRFLPGDLYLLKFILHDWDDESCVKILRRCREAMEPGGRIAILEFVVGD